MAFSSVYFIFVTKERKKTFVFTLWVRLETFSWAALFCTLANITTWKKSKVEKLKK